MTIYTVSTAKKVKVTARSGRFMALLVQDYKGEEQVLQSKTFSRLSSAEKWARKIS